VFLLALLDDGKSAVVLPVVVVVVVAVVLGVVVVVVVVGVAVVDVVEVDVVVDVVVLKLVLVEPATNKTAFYFTDISNKLTPVFAAAIQLIFLITNPHHERD